MTTPSPEPETLPYPEVIVASDRLEAERYAIAQGWNTTPDDRSYFTRSGANGQFIPIRFVSVPESLELLPEKTLVHVGRFSGGVPAAIAKQLARHRVSCDLSEVRVGAFKPMRDAPRDRPIAIYDGRRRTWQIARYRGTGPDAFTFWNVVGTAAWVSYPVCWVDAPEPPPEVMIKLALGEMTPEPTGAAHG
jgi:hypothetical protein